MSFYHNFNSLIKNYNESHRRNYLEFRNNQSSKLHQVLKKLIQEGLILGYKWQKKDKKKIIYLNSLKSVPFIKLFKNKKKLSYYQLLSLIYKKPSSLIFVLTPEGILNTNEILQKKRGGQLLCIVLFNRKYNVS